MSPRLRTDHLFARFWTPFVPLVIVGVGLAAAVGLNVVEHYESTQRQRALVIDTATHDANLINALEWQALAMGTEPAELSKRRTAITQRLRGTAASFPADDGMHEVIETYLAAVEQEFSFLAQGQLDAAKEIDDTLVDPSFDALSEKLSDAASRYRDAAERGETATRIASTGIFVGGGLLLAVLLWSAERWSRRAHALVARESARQEHDERLRPLQERLQELAAVIEATPDFVITLDGAGKVKYFNRAVRLLLGHPDSEDDAGVSASQVRDHTLALARDLIPDDALLAAAGEGSWMGEHEVISAAGDAIPTSLSIVVHRAPDDAIEFTSIIARDMSTQKQLEEDLRHQAFHDPLTGLSNRAQFIDRLEHALTRSRRTAEQVAVIFMDLDEFKAVNDSYGHDVGDALLVATGKRLSGIMREGDTVARLGGDEFAILLDGGLDSGRAEAFATHIVESMRSPFDIGGLRVMTRTSAGLALSTGDETGSELLRRADLAMYTSKTNGKNSFATYNFGIQKAIGSRLELINELQGAVERNEFILEYQPTVNVATGRITGAEALVRWQHPDRGLIPPLKFIPLAEESGVIVELGRWVLLQACERLAEWHRMGLSGMTVAVNVAVRQLQEPDFADTVRNALERFDLTPGSLTIEITESAMMRDVGATVSVLTELHALGVRLAIDDFGTGYSSLSYLRQFPFGILKIDKSFIDTITTSGSKLTSAIVGIAKSLELEIVAEGVEQPEQLAALRALACDTAQGFLFSRPVPASEISALLRRAQSDAA